MTDRRIVITGIGVISPVGHDLKSTWEGLKAGRSGISRITSLDPSPYSTQIAGEIRDFDPAPFFKSPKDARRVDRYTQFAVAAASMALTDSGIELDKENRDRIGVIIGSGIGGLGTFEEQHRKLVEKGPGKVSPFMIPYMISNIASGIVSIEHGLGGPNMAVVTACATSNHAIGEAWRLMKFGDADIMLAGGAEATILSTGLAGFGNMKALSTRNDEPERASRPYDIDRDGFVMGEGGGVLILETLEHAQARGAKIYGELVGYGMSADAYHLTAPHPEGHGAIRCMKMAIEHAGVTPDQIGYVNAHGTSTGLGDIAETKAIKAAFGDWAKNGLLVSSTKSMHGHLLGAAGAIELSACLMAMQDDIIPPTINLENQDPECDLDYVANKAREKRIDYALSNSFGFGGHNASLVVKRFS